MSDESQPVTGDTPRRLPDWVGGDHDPDDEKLEWYSSLPGPPESEMPLTSVRVRKLAAERRAVYRARSYFVVALGVCAVAAAQLVLLTVRHVRHAGWQLRPVGYVCGILAAAMAATFVYRRAAALTRELRHRPAALDEPQTPPDFSTLSDGSHYWKNLQEMTEGT